VRTKSLFTILVFALVLSNNAIAQKPATKKSQPDRPPKNPACADLTTQAGMTRCQMDKYQKADEELNKVYQQLVAKLSQEQKQKLKTAQTAWIQFRDAHCECEASFTAEGGSLESPLKYACLESETRARIKQLKSLIQDVSQ
jgi:uncharacterized protein YecT (DUF1311 family)